MGNTRFNRGLTKIMFKHDMAQTYTRHAVPPQTPEDWFRHLFGAKSALDGSVVRRKVRDMERMVGREAFATEIRRRGFTAVENGDQVVVFCNASPVRMIVTGDTNFEKSL